MADDKIWFIVQGHEEQGPYSPTQLQAMVQKRVITNAQAVRRKGELDKSTVGQALALKKQLQRNQFAGSRVQKHQRSTFQSMQDMMAQMSPRSGAFRIILVIILLLALNVAGLYFSGKYLDEPFATYFKMIGIG